LTGQPERVAIIGGTGITDLPGLSPQERVVGTPYGPVTVLLAEAEPFPVVYLNRHGLKRENPPHQINYRGNICALRMLGVKKVIATNAVGSINREMPPRSLVILDDYLDFTSGRHFTFFDGGSSGHAYSEMNVPCCPGLRQKMLGLAGGFDLHLYPHGTYVCTNGPRFETPAEIRMFNNLGGDVVGMTGIPEVVLAHELGMHYAAVAYSINWAAGIESQIEIVREGIPDLLSRLLSLMLKSLQSQDPSQCGCANPIFTVYPAQEGGGVHRD
jgi:5'-methylthioadenosine phosphorylase